MLRKMPEGPGIGKLVVPIVPDEARTSAWSRCFGRWESIRAWGRKYEPVDVNTLLYYKEAKDGQILE